jgi:hypothetical protein
LNVQIDTSKISKTTVQGFLGLAIVVIIAVSTLPPKASAAAISVAVLKAVVGWLQHDARNPDDGEAK